MSSKDVGLRIRVERKLRDEFLEVCRAQDRPAAQVVREFMRRHISEYRLPGPSRRAPGDSVNENP